MDTGLPKVSSVEFDTGPVYPMPTTRIDDFRQPLNNAIARYKCKMQLPCGRCELTKELCTYDYK